MIIEPRSVAIIGASNDRDSVGYALVKNTMSARCDVFLVNPNHEEIEGKKCYPSVKDIPYEVEAAIIAVPAKVVPDVLKECGEKKVKYVYIISAGFAEAGNVDLQDKLVSIANRYSVKIVGPNCLGLMRPGYVNATFAPYEPKSGGIGFISQSGALVDAMVDMAKESYGFSAIVSVGNSAMLDITDFIEVLDQDEKTKVIAIYMESIKDGREFINVVKKAKKPVVVLKSGKSERGAKTALTHTGKLATDYSVYRGAFRQAGAIEVNTFTELFSVSVLMELVGEVDDMVVVTNAGGGAVLASDYAEKYGVDLIDLRKETIRRLDKVLPEHYSRQNPLDIIGDATSERYWKALDILMKEKYVKSAFVIVTPQLMTDVDNIAMVVAKIKQKYKKPIVCSFIGGSRVKNAIHYLREHGIPNFREIEDAMFAISKTKKKGE